MYCVVFVCCCYYYILLLKGAKCQADVGEFLLLFLVNFTVLGSAHRGCYMKIANMFVIVVYMYVEQVIF